MNTQQQAYIEGFVKRANEYGFNQYEAVEILKQAFDTSFMSDSEYYDGIPYAREAYDSAIGPMQPGMKEAIIDKLKALGSGARGKAEAGIERARDLGGQLSAGLEGVKEVANKGYNDFSERARDLGGQLSAGLEGVKEVAHKGYNDFSDALSHIDPRTAALIAGGGALAGGGGYLLKRHLDKKKQQQQQQYN